MKQVDVAIIDSNSATFAAGSRAPLQEDAGAITHIAGHAIETVTYSDHEQRVYIRTELGYHFTITAADYHRLVAK